MQQHHDKVKEWQSLIEITEAVTLPYVIIGGISGWMGHLQHCLENIRISLLRRGVVLSFTAASDDRPRCQDSISRRCV